MTINIVLANERMQELGRLHSELGSIKWAGCDDGWNLAISAVRSCIEYRIVELARKYAPETVTAQQEMLRVIHAAQKESK